MKYIMKQLKITMLILLILNIACKKSKTHPYVEPPGPTTKYLITTIRFNQDSIGTYYAGLPCNISLYLDTIVRTDASPSNWILASSTVSYIEGAELSMYLKNLPINQDLTYYINVIVTLYIPSTGTYRRARYSKKHTFNSGDNGTFNFKDL